MSSLCEIQYFRLFCVDYLVLFIYISIIQCLLKDKMNTTTWKEIAEHRHNYMLDYLKEFYSERKWEL